MKEKCRISRVRIIRSYMRDHKTIRKNAIYRTISPGLVDGWLWRLEGFEASGEYMCVSLDEVQEPLDWWDNSDFMGKWRLHETLRRPRTNFSSLVTRYIADKYYHP